jgi:iron complex outermembrane receptor protein
VTDAGDVVRPFTLRGLSPDHTLVLLNGWRRHQTALVNNFTYGMGAGSSGVDLNAIPSSALDRIEVLRDGAAAQYGSDAIAGVVNLVLKDGRLHPVRERRRGPLRESRLPDDGTTVNANGGWGIPIGAGSLGLFGEFRDRQPTNRAWADASETSGTGIADDINDKGQVVHKNNPVEQPNHHWGDGLERDALTFANFRLPVGTSGTEIYSFGGYSHRDGIGNPYRRYSGSARSWDDIYPLGFLPTFRAW